VRPLHRTVLAAGLGTILTIVVTALPALHFAYRRPLLHLVLETTSGLVALLAAYMIAARFRQRGRLEDLALALALIAFAWASLVFAAFPMALSSERTTFSTWAPLGARFVGAVLIGFAAFSRPLVLRSPQKPLALGLSGLATVMLAIAVVVSSLAGRLPPGVDARFSPSELDDSLFVGPAGISVVQLVAAALFAAAAVGFTASAERRRDELMAWFGPAAALGAIARLNYALFPSIVSDWVYVGDLLRLGFYMLVLVGAAREIERYRGEAMEAAVLRERRRIARDLHDGLAQELTFIARRGRILARDPVAARQVASAAERALTESRRAIAALTRPLDQPLEGALEEAVQEVASRVGVRVETAIARGIVANGDTREALIRIACEAVLNAARHGHARVVRVELDGSEPLRLRISDDGDGFNPEAAAAALDGGFGLVSMRERAEQLGGHFRVRSRHGAGAEVEVEVP
jgi:signal transduction histidine kinase